jgi:hypothetical protein
MSSLFYSPTLCKGSTSDTPEGTASPKSVPIA